MYVYIRSKYEQLWVAGFYSPDGKWNAESDHSTSDEAAERVHWLNGGNDNELDDLRHRVEVLEEAKEEKDADEQLAYMVKLYTPAQ